MDTQPQPSENTPQNGSRRGFNKKHAAIFILIVALLVGGGYLYYNHQQEYPSTDDAYVHGNIVYIAPQVDGRLKTVAAKNYNHVHEAAILFTIDPAPYEAALAQATAAYQLASQENKASSQDILAASADVTAQIATQKNTQLKYDRTMKLVADGDLPEQKANDAQASLINAKAAVAAAREKMAALIAKQGVSGKNAPAVREASAALLQTTLNLSYTNIEAPFDGQLGLVNAHPGSVVTMGLALTPLVQTNSFWVQANYKEDDLGRIKPGLPAAISLDMYPDTQFKGVVDRVSPASGSAFSLLPPENASGNWVKITQRFPVSIRLLDWDNSRYPLRVGASASVTVNTLASPLSLAQP